MKTIVIDAGHGGTDVGASNKGRYEKNDNLRLALKLAEILRACGQNVVLTRSTDVAVPLITRSAISNANRADLFISIHRNSFSNPAAYGVENYVQIGAPQVNWRYAETVMAELAKTEIRNNRGVKAENFSVLRNSLYPAMLLEMGFISNDEDNVLFDKNINIYAQAIADGILKALNEQCITPGPTTPAKGDPVIRSIQQTLNVRYGQSLVADGLYGPRTKKAMVAGLQSELNTNFGAKLNVDGIWGPKTKAAVPNVRLNNRGNIVWLIQAMLYMKGYKIAVDGIFGKNTDNAVRNFQKANGLSADGIVGKNTFEKLFS